VAAIALCGLRLGALVAMRAAPTIADLAAIVLLAPPVSGRQLMRQVRTAASMSSLSHLDPVPPADSGLPLNTNGFVWSGALQRRIAEIDLAEVMPSAPVLVVAERANRAAQNWAATLRDRGADVGEREFSDYETYMCDPTTHVVPAKSFAAVTAWLADRVPEVVPSTSQRSGDPVLAMAGVSERPVLIDGRLAGIMTEPTDRPAAPVAALLLHEGSSHSIGNGRAYVALARRLARRGIASLRMDLSGVGDSPAGDNDRNPHYDPEREPEVTLAIDQLGRLGYARVATFGLCSGAYTAYQAALADERVVGLITINLQKFVWTYGDDIRVAVRAMKRTLPSYLRSMRNPAEWRRLLTGQADLVGVGMVMARRAWTQLVHRASSLLPPRRGSTGAIVHDQMRLLSRRGVRTHFLFSRHDPGVAEMLLRFGPAARRLRTFVGARMIVFDRADHHFNGQDARARYFRYVDQAMDEIIDDCTLPARAARLSARPAAAQAKLAS
jgi:hypothetical protein